MKRCAHRFCQPVWRRREQLLTPPPIADWLFDTGSLTRRLQQACAGHFRVELVDQHWARPQLNERRRLGMSARHLALIRQVYLYCDDTPCVFARTIIPRPTLSGAERHLAVLGNRPLGAVLFADPRMHREPMEFTRLQAGERLFGAAVQRLDAVPAVIWGRRSLFYLAAKPLLVNEIFLPAIEKL
ncbi:chorismate--pyruvate lyase family protein [Thiohalophilus sp.]|uniref:chorismate--pyruvate lyase family protein n=1 Tax=Thiohalophilus sp. TaxID=3028392 RepID=UPI002ACEAC01|nr:chorismate lyase [Thiohalophilus sp.]MDZ7803672.1 chorismate lyase [Thiohalophilus sp.]